MAQVQFGMHVIDEPSFCTSTHFFEYRPPPNEFMLSTELLNLVAVPQNADWARLNVWLLHEFWAEVQTYRNAVGAAKRIPDHYRSEAAASVWYKKRLLAEPERFHAHQRTLFKRNYEYGGGGGSADLGVTIDEPCAGADIDWGGVSVSSPAAPLSAQRDEPLRRRAAPGSDISW